jgi:hypothetical protein
MPSYSVRAFVRVRGQDAYRQRTKAEIDAEIRRLAARDQQKRQRVIDDLRRCDEACAEAKPNYCEDLSAVAKRARFKMQPGCALNAADAHGCSRKLHTTKCRTQFKTDYLFLKTYPTRNCIGFGKKLYSG